MKEEIFHIAIDGPVASGKGTAARALSEKLNIPCLDTGAMYRAFAVFILDCSINPKDEAAVLRTLAKFNLEMRIADKTYVTVNGTEVTDKIRANEISMISSILSVIPAVRQKMVALQREISRGQSFILEGRDIASVVLPNARFKFYLTADVGVRASRRAAELAEKGVKITIEEMTKQIKERDRNDMEKPVGALKRVRDAILINNTHLTREQTAEQMLSYILNV